MRKTRQKVKGESCYYHLMSRISGSAGEFPFGDIEKEYAFTLLADLSQLYFLEVISFCAMGNHWHLIVFDSGKKPTDKEILSHYNSYLKRHKKPVIKGNLTTLGMTQLRERLTDISSLMKDLKQAFTVWFNRRHQRRGSLWADRFKSTILEGEQALWNCVKYVELNSVRAGIVDDPAEYRFCSWGRFRGSGKHPFAAHFLKHMRRTAYHNLTEWNDEDVFASFAAELARIINIEQGKSEELISEAMVDAKRKESMPLLFLRRSRYWTDGAIIGSKGFVQRIAVNFDNKKRVEKKRMGRGRDDVSGEYLHSYKLIRN